VDGEDLLCLANTEKESMPKGGLRIGAGRKEGTQNKFTEALKKSSVKFFERLLDDETEAKFWRYFMTGWTIDEETRSCIPIPLNKTCWEAFKRAVEYKRGMPIALKSETEIDVEMAFGIMAGGETINGEEDNQSRRADKPN
jgi:hypothetical protein